MVFRLVVDDAWSECNFTAIDIGFFLDAIFHYQSRLLSPTRASRNLFNVALQEILLIATAWIDFDSKPERNFPEHVSPANILDAPPKTCRSLPTPIIDQNTGKVLEADDESDDEDFHIAQPQDLCPSIHIQALFPENM